MVITLGQPVPTAWDGAAVVLVDDAALAEPGPAVAALHQAWVPRTPVVVALAVDPVVFRTPESFGAEPWRLGPDFEPWLDRLALPGVGQHLRRPQRSG